MAGQRLIICNTSPLINVAEIDCLYLFDGLPGMVVAPPAVLAELRLKAGLFPLAAALAESSEFLTTWIPSDSLLVRSFAATLHAGESECLALAMENPGSLLVLGDLSARAAARSNQPPFTGILGILAKAKADARIPSLALVLEALKSRARFWINPELEALLLRQAGE